LDIVTLNVLENFLLVFPWMYSCCDSRSLFYGQNCRSFYLCLEVQGIIDDFPGNYSDFRTYEDSIPKNIDASEKKPEKKQWKKDSNSQLSYNEQKELKNIESKLKSLEHDKKELEVKFNDESLSSEKINELSTQLQHIIETIEEKELRWMELLEKLEN